MRAEKHRLQSGPVSTNNSEDMALGCASNTQPNTTCIPIKSSTVSKASSHSFSMQGLKHSVDKV